MPTMCIVYRYFSKARFRSLFQPDTMGMGIVIKVDIKFLTTASVFKIVKLRQGSGKERQGMAVKAKGLKALSLAKSLH